MKDTSIKAYKVLLEKGIISIQEKVVLEVLNKPRTSRKISEKTGLERGSVTGRINSLCEKNLVVEHDRVRCPVSGRIVHRYKVAKHG